MMSLGEFLIFYLITYGIPSAIFSAVAVKNKNRNQVVCFFLGLIFGVFAIVAARNPDRVEAEQGPSLLETPFDLSSQTKKCPDCTEVIKLEARVCRYCHHQFSEEETAFQVAAAEQEHLLRNYTHKRSKSPKRSKSYGVWEKFYVKKAGGFFWGLNLYTIESLKADVASGLVRRDWLVSPNQISQKISAGELLDRFPDDD
jgi:hypothetical protein